MSRKDNEDCYCDIMFANASRTSKSKLPGLVYNLLAPTDPWTRQHVLDVGCADGRFTKCLKDSLPDNVSVIGLEPDRRRWKKAIKLMGTDGRLAFFNSSFDEAYSGEHELFDCVLFSSSLHEIASANKTSRYTSLPVVWAVQKAAQLLKKGGVVIARDFVLPNSCQYGMMDTMFVTTDMERKFLKYMNDCPFIDMFGDEPKLLDIWGAPEKPTVFSTPRRLLLEFMLCATWGDAAWKREIKERKLICTVAQWNTVFREYAGLRDVNIKTYAEEYPKYFSRETCIMSPAGWSWPKLSITITGRKA